MSLRNAELVDVKNIDYVYVKYVNCKYDNIYKNSS